MARGERDDSSARFDNVVWRLVDPEQYTLLQKLCLLYTGLNRAKNGTQSMLIPSEVSTMSDQSV